MKRRARGLLASFALVLLAAFVMAGCGSSDGDPSGQTSQQLQAALSRYENYLQKNGAKLTHWADTIVLKIDEGAVTKAESRYAASRVPYGHLDPVAQLFVPLNARINGLENEVPPDQFGGFHEIEKMLYWEEVTAGMTPVAKQLRIDIEELQRRIDSTHFQPQQILAGANKALAGMLVNEIWGNAERYAHMDLTDLAAKIEGLDAAFKATKPLLVENDPTLAARIEAQFREVYAKVGLYGTLAREPEQARDREPGISFVVYDQVTQEEKWELAQPIEALAALFSQAGTKLANS